MVGLGTGPALTRCLLNRNAALVLLHQIELKAFAGAFGVLHDDDDGRIGMICRVKGKASHGAVIKFGGVRFGETDADGEQRHTQQDEANRGGFVPTFGIHDPAWSWFGI